MMYTAAFGSMFEGSMCGAGANVFAVWLYALSRCDSDGDVELCPKPVSLLIGCSEDDVRGAIEYLTAPDPDSRSDEEDGRRLVQTGKFLFRVVNRKHYAEIMSYQNKKERDRQRQQAKRDEAKAAEEPMNQAVVALRRFSSPTVADRRGPSHIDIDRDRDRDRDLERDLKEKNISPSGKRKKKVTKKPEYTPEFEAFWNLSWKRGSKRAAFQSWKQMDENDRTEAQLVISGWTEAVSFREPNFRPHVVTWLNSGGWEGSLEAETAPKKLRPGDKGYIPTGADYD
jgi:hypothetical protein